VEVILSGNVTASQISSLVITSSESDATTTVSFMLTGQSGAVGFTSLIIPKSAVPYGTTPTIYIDEQQAASQGYTQDNENYYVWFTTHFSIHQVKISFTGGAESLQVTSLWYILAFVAILTVITGSVYVIFRENWGNNTSKL